MDANATTDPAVEADAAQTAPVAPTVPPDDAGDPGVLGGADVDAPVAGPADVDGAADTADGPVTAEAIINPDGTIEINGKTYAVEEIDKPMPPTPDNPQQCPDCEGIFERHEIVLGKCQPCNTKAQEAEKSAGAKVLEGINRLIHAGDREAAAE